MKDYLKLKIVWLLALTALLLVLGVVESVATEPVTSAPAARPTEEKEAIPQVGAPSSTKMGAPSDEMGRMISDILGEIDDRWSEVFRESGQTFTGPKIVLFRNVTNGGRCGMAQSAMGPFYCRPDQKSEVETRLNACSGSTCKSRRHTLLPVKSVTTCKTCSESCRA